MKTLKRISATLRTTIDDISDIGSELSGEQLSLVSGGLLTRLGGFGGRGVVLSATGDTTYPASITNPGEPDTATDTEQDH